MDARAAHEVRVAPNIYRTPYGWRVYVRRRDAKTGRSTKKPVRFKSEVTLEELEHFRDSYKLESKRLRIEARKLSAEAAAALHGTFEEAATTYLQLKTVQAMPSFKDRARDIRRWQAVFGRQPRAAITTRAIDEQLQLWINEGRAASTVNHRRTALMALFTTLDGRAAANPVRAARVFEEPELEARGLAYDLIVRILDAVPTARSYSHLRHTKLRYMKTKPRIELEAWTGMRPSQIGRLRPEHFSVEDRWYVIPRSLKGRGKKPRHPRPMTRKPMSHDAAAAFARFHALNCYGKYSASSRRRIFNEAVRAAEQAIRTERQDPTFRFPRDLVPYDLRHSFGTEMLRRTKNLETVAELLDQSSTRMTKRYALGAIPEVLKDAVEAFQANTARGGPIEVVVKPPAAPRRRGTTL